MLWPEALELLSAELGEPVTFRVTDERQFRERLTGAGYRRGRLSSSSRASARSSLARTTKRPPPSRKSPAAPHAQVAEFLHDYRAEFLGCRRVILTRSWGILADGLLQRLCCLQLPILVPRGTATR
jgi:hypothetical protein